MDLINIVKNKAKEIQNYIIFPDAAEERMLRAIDIILQEKIAKPILIGKAEELKAAAEKLNLKLDWNRIKIMDQQESVRLERYSEALYELRKNKGMASIEEAKKILTTDANYYGAMAAYLKEADGIVSGTTHPTSETIRPALQIIQTKEKFHKVSGVFFMVLEKRLLLFADCAITIDPNSHDLADIAIDTATTAQRFGLKPKIAMLSFSTNGSAKHPLVDKVKEATALIKDHRPDLDVEGEMQVDAALIPEVAARKFPGSKLQGDANVLVFPDLQSANIAYKLVERLGNARAIGPLIQGLQRPVNKLSRGCSVEDIVDVVAFTVCESGDAQFNLN